MSLQDDIDQAHDLATARWGRGTAIELLEEGSWHIAKVWSKDGRTVLMQARDVTKAESVRGLIGEIEDADMAYVPPRFDPC